MNKPPETEKRKAWIGWRRRSVKYARWQAVAQGETEQEAFQKLLEAADQDRAGSFDNVVLPDGEKP